MSDDIGRAPTSAELREQVSALTRQRRDLIDLANATAAEEARQARLAREARRPKEPVVVLDRDLPVIRFDRATSGRTYKYAAILFPVGLMSHSNGRRWAVTNTQHGVEGRYTWAGLLDFIGEANWPSIRVWEDEGRALVDPADEPAVVERIGKYGSVICTEPVEPWLGRAGSSGAPY